MTRSGDLSPWWCLALLPLAGCGPSLVGLFAAGHGGGGSSTVVNPTLTVSGPAAFSNSATASWTVTTTPPGMALEAQLDAGSYQGIASPHQVTGLAEGEHTLRVRVAGAPASEQETRWTVDTTPPAAPAGVTVTATAAGVLRVAWTAGSDALSGLASYTIDYGTGSGAPYAQHGSATAPATSTDLGGLSACQTYYVTVSCTDRAANQSSATAEVSGRASCGGDGTFAQSLVTVGSGTSVVAKGDFNGDGIVDLATDDGHHLQILLGGGSLGRGDGTFQGGAAYDTGATIYGLAVADVDQDAIQDIVLITNAQLRVYRGLGSGGVGNGQFVLHQTLSANLNTPQALVVRDFDADGIQDIVVGNGGGNTLVTFQGNGSGGRGDGTFAFLASVATGATPGAIAVGDFNADGIQDLAVACQSGTEVLVTHLGNGSSARGNGTFASMQVWLSGGFVGGDVVVADMNSDGVDDLVVTLALANIVCFLAGSGSGGRGTGVFFLEEVVSVGLTPWGLLSGEFTGDGIPDFVALSYGHAGATLLASHGSQGRGDGTYQTSVAGAAGPSLFHGVAADVDGNGSLDLLLCDLGGGVRVLRNHGRTGVGDGTFAGRGVDQWVIGTAYGIATGDFNGDRAPDLIVASFQTPYPGGSDFCTVFQGEGVRGLGTGNLSVSSNPTVGAGPTAFACGDFDRDRIQDLAVLCSDLDRRGGGDRVDVLAGAGSSGMGSGYFGGGQTVGTGLLPRAVLAGDFNADGILDLAVANQQSDTVTILLGQGSGGRGNGQFTAQAPVAAGTGPFALVSGDFNCDGIVDLAVGNCAAGGSGGLTLLLGQGSGGRGNGSFGTGTTLATSHCITGLLAGDFDGDGILDLVSANYRTGGATAGSGVTLFHGNGSGGRGDGTFTAGSEVAIGGNPLALVAGDFDHDHVLDLAVTRQDAAEVRVLLGHGSAGRGDGTFAAPVAVGLDAIANAILCVDLDSDGVVDLVTAGGDRLSVRFGRGSY